MQFNFFFTIIGDALISLDKLVHFAQERLVHFVRNNQSTSPLEETHLRNCLANDNKIDFQSINWLFIKR